MSNIFYIITRPLNRLFNYFGYSITCQKNLYMQKGNFAFMTEDNGKLYLEAKKMGYKKINVKQYRKLCRNVKRKHTKAEIEEITNLFINNT
jgi:uncharacterized protein YaaW (UPF0174 family)